MELTICAKPMLEELPTELLLQIFGYLDLSGNPSSSRPRLEFHQPIKALSLVNWKFRGILMEKLFQTIHYKLVYACRCSWSDIVSWSLPQFPHLACLHKSLGIRTHVKTLRLEDPVRLQHLSSSWNANIQLSQTLPSLRVLHLQTMWPEGRYHKLELEPHSPAHRWFLPTVEELHVQCHSLELARACPNAKTLHIQCTHERGNPPDHHFAGSEQVIELHYHGELLVDQVNQFAATYPRLEKLFVRQNVFTEGLVEEPEIDVLIFNLLLMLPNLQYLASSWTFDLYGPRMRAKVVLERFSYTHGWEVWKPNEDDGEELRLVMKRDEEDFEGRDSNE
ncbi:hypothetical protein CC86DRAFT_406284 [Ophiobolus disseminans]|uniref:F-box domain-containing protein n=1 Tax=Ophiobolus disseminans TaxID=1469910 RepID=A0A6A7A3B9_9PLEO|nr:hypothetical protein CC86DRAFT_406284 [Ophiobolus disseminans]